MVTAAAPATQTRATRHPTRMQTLRLRAKIFFTFKQEKIKSLGTELAELYAARADSIKESNPRRAAKLYTSAAEQWKLAAKIYLNKLDDRNAKECYYNAAFYFQKASKCGTAILLLHEADKL